MPRDWARCRVNALRRRRHRPADSDAGARRRARARPRPGSTRPHGPVAAGVAALRYLLLGIIGVICSYMVRHYAFTLNRLFGRQRHPYTDILLADWPTVTVVIPLHNEASVAVDILDALLDADYPHGKLRILPVNDRSDDETGDDHRRIRGASSGPGLSVSSARTARLARPRRSRTPAPP